MLNLFIQVVRDTELMFIYGELDLRFLPELTSAPLIISIVKMAMEDKNLRYASTCVVFCVLAHQTISTQKRSL